MSYLFDTNIVSYLVKNHPKTKTRFKYLYEQKEEIGMSCLTYYEVKRGLLAINATRQLSDFQQFCQQYIEVIFLTDIDIIETASAIHADLTRRGLPVQDIDILIAAIAIRNDLILVSNDTDLKRIKGLKLETWT